MSASSSEYKRCVYALLQGLNIHFDNVLISEMILNVSIERPVSKRAVAKKFLKSTGFVGWGFNLSDDIRKFSITDSDDCQLVIMMTPRLNSFKRSFRKLKAFGLYCIRPMTQKLGLDKEILGMTGKGIHECLREQMISTQPIPEENVYHISIRNDELEVTVEMSFVVQVWEYVSIPSTGRTTLSSRIGPWYL